MSCNFILVYVLIFDSRNWITVIHEHVLLYLLTTSSIRCCSINLNRTTIDCVIMIVSNKNIPTPSEFCTNLLMDEQWADKTQGVHFIPTKWAKNTCSPWVIYPRWVIAHHEQEFAHEHCCSPWVMSNRVHFTHTQHPWIIQKPVVIFVAKTTRKHCDVTMPYWYV